jgi:hypothetical protein
MTARREVEIRVPIPAGKGGPADVLALLVDHHLPTLTRSCTADRQGVLLLLTTSRPEEVQQVLEAAGYQCHTHPVVVIGPYAYQPGATARLLSDLIGQGVNVTASYLSTVAADQCFVVVRTTNDDRMLELVQAAA